MDFSVQLNRNSINPQCFDRFIQNNFATVDVVPFFFEQFADGGNQGVGLLAAGGVLIVLVLALVGAVVLVGLAKIIFD